jgi:pyruvate-formate lyase-activating enzyme
MSLKNNPDNLPKDYDLYCPAIWKQVFMNTRGSIFPCCEWTNITPTIKTKLPQLSSHGPECTDVLQEARETVMNGKIPKGCLTCKIDESKGVKSHRQTLIDVLGAVDKKHIKDNLVDAESIEYLDIRLGNTCNFMCNFCSPHNSHLIGKEWIADKSGPTPKDIAKQFLHRDSVKYTLSKTISDHPTKEKFIESIHRYPNLKSVKIGGGEPFFQKKQTFRIIEKIPYKEKVELKILTNCSVYDEEILQVTNNFREVNLALSIDATGRTLEISRWKSNWKTIQENIRKLKKWREHCNGNLKLSLIPAMSVYTILDLPNLLEFATEQEIPTNVGFVQDPESQMINLIRGKYLIKLKGKIHKKVVQGKIRKDLVDLDSIYGQLDYATLNNGIEKNIIETFWYYQKYFERNRKYSLKEELPELYSSIKTV